MGMPSAARSPIAHWYTSGFSYCSTHVASSCRVASTFGCVGQVRYRVTSGSLAQLSYIACASSVVNLRRISRGVSIVCVPACSIPIPSFYYRSFSFRMAWNCPPQRSSSPSTASMPSAVRVQFSRVGPPASTGHTISSVCGKSVS